MKTIWKTVAVVELLLVLPAALFILKTAFGMAAKRRKRRKNKGIGNIRGPGFISPAE